MFLEFASLINNEPTYFVERIWSGLFDFTDQNFIEYSEYLTEYRQKYKDPSKTIFDEKVQHIQPKIHTIRTDKHDKIHAGTFFKPCIKTKDGSLYQFAPALEVVSIQRIVIAYIHGKENFPFISIQDENYREVKKLSPVQHFNYITELDRIAKNSGFDSVEKFLKFFNKNTVKKIIHWTKFKY